MVQNHHQLLYCRVYRALVFTKHNISYFDRFSSMFCYLITKILCDEGGAGTGKVFGMVANRNLRHKGVHLTLDMVGMFKLVSGAGTGKVFGLTW